jgi:hypothetical protein
MTIIPANLRLNLAFLAALLGLFVGGRVAVSRERVDPSNDAQARTALCAPCSEAPAVADQNAPTGKEVYRRPALSALRARLIRRREKDDGVRLVTQSIPQAGALPLVMAFSARSEDAAGAFSRFVSIVPGCAVGDWSLPAVVLSRIGR